MEKNFEYKTKQMISLIIFNGIFFTALIISLFFIKNNIILFAVGLYSLYLFYEILWAYQGRIQLIIKNDFFIIKKKLLKCSFFNKQVFFSDIQKANLLKDANANKKIGFDGMYFNLKYDYCIEIIFKNKSIKNYIFEVDKENSLKVFNYIKSPAVP